MTSLKILLLMISITLMGGKEQPNPSAQDEIVPVLKKVSLATFTHEIEAMIRQEPVEASKGCFFRCEKSMTQAKQFLSKTSEYLESMGFTLENLHQGAQTVFIISSYVAYIAGNEAMGKTLEKVAKKESEYAEKARKVFDMSKGITRLAEQLVQMANEQNSVDVQKILQEAFLMLTTSAARFDNDTMVYFKGDYLALKLTSPNNLQDDIKDAFAFKAGSIYQIEIRKDQNVDELKNVQNWIDALINTEKKLEGISALDKLLLKSLLTIFAPLGKMELDEEKGTVKLKHWACLASQDDSGYLATFQFPNFVMYKPAKTISPQLVPLLEDAVFTPQPKTDSEDI